MCPILTIWLVWLIDGICFLHFNGTDKLRLDESSFSNLGRNIINVFNTQASFNKYFTSYYQTLWQKEN